MKRLVIVFSLQARTSSVVMFELVMFGFGQVEMTMRGALANHPES
jgi:hypothetical protein